jgi:cation diffusion facilitator family transporter
MAVDTRHHLLRRGLWLTIVVVGWNVIEGFVAVTAGMLASSVALISFGIDSSIEVLSSFVVAWRLRAELAHADVERAQQLEKRAAPITGGLLLILAAYIVVDAGRRLLGIGEEPQTSWAGMALTSLSLVIMPVVGWAKLRTAEALGSGSLRADAYETITCAWLSFTTLAGLVLNALFHWTWADPLAALLILPLIVREGWEACATGQEAD